MKFIEGKVGKSKVLAQIIQENQNKKILLVDTVHVNVLYINDIDVINFKDNDEMWTEFINDEKFNDFIVTAKKYDLIIFETNDDKSTLDGYDIIEDKTETLCIVTIQNNEIEEIKIWEV